ncbi:unnamed protein product [Lactuca virosa]|uniref:Uncharacterized protein n=1 Tax=Lactuca virosa TaxID=75947 RepID=A0AAU9N1C0_9ASTR|nr:unnamed protein product [Lactuca virosa]
MNESSSSRRWSAPDCLVRTKRKENESRSGTQRREQGRDERGDKGLRWFCSIITGKGNTKKKRAAALLVVLGSNRRRWLQWLIKGLF